MFWKGQRFHFTESEISQKVFLEKKIFKYFCAAPSQNVMCLTNQSESRLSKTQGFLERDFLLPEGFTFVKSLCTPPMQDARSFHEKSTKASKIIKNRREIVLRGRFFTLIFKMFDDDFS